MNMAGRPPKVESPNAKIDKTIDAMMDKLSGGEAIAPDVAVKILNTAISWEKVKHQIKDAENPFNPDDL
jgi:hypothetical protein